MQLIDLLSFDWIQEIVVADAKAAECLRLMRVVATGAIVGVSECDIVDAGIKAAHVVVGTTVNKMRWLRGIHVLSENRVEECGNEETEVDGLTRRAYDRDEALSCGYDWIGVTNAADIEAKFLASQSPICDTPSRRDLLVCNEV
jgi:hypothetical protein